MMYCNNHQNESRNMKLELFMEIINTMSLPTTINYQNVEQIDNEKKEQINKIISELVNNNEEMFNNKLGQKN